MLCFLTVLFASKAIMAKGIRVRGNDPADPSGKPVGASWTPGLEAMLCFLTVLFASKALMAKVIRVRGYAAQKKSPVILYTDASHSPHLSGLGICISDPSTGSKYYSAAVCPAWVLAQFVHQDHVVNQLELLVMVTAYLSFPEILRGRQVLHHVDNAAAIAAAINGYSSKVDLAHMANMYNLVVALMDVDAWVEYVASHANIADIPSKLGNEFVPRHEDWGMLEGMGFVEAPMSFPTQAEWENLALFEDRLHVAPQ